MARTVTSPSTAAETRKSVILNEAMKLFAEKGYQVTSLDEVAKNLGVTKAALYYYFESKNEILAELINLATERMKKSISLGKSKLPPTEKLHRFVQTLVEDNTDTIELAKIISEQADNLPKRTRDIVKRRKKEVDATLQGILQEGVEKGEFDIQDVKLVSYAIIGLCDWTYHWYKPGNRLTPEQIARIFIDFIDHGCLRP